MIAAFLTLVGLSVNDTVVVFDRIRENQKIFRSMSISDLMNKSINETLSRTIITSGTILIVLIVLLVVGGEVTRGFAFALTVGIVVGTYSSIFVASAVALDWTLKTKTSGKLIE
jgi:preprotein translocase subunit SecF